MSIVGVRELSARASAILSEVEATGKPALVTRRGRPIAALVLVDEDDFYDSVLARAPEYVKDMRDAEKAIASGDLGQPLGDVLNELESTDT